MVPMAHANDGGGSIRIPAACCGIFGLKPTRGRNPLGPHYGDMFSGLVAEHAVTRSVRDSAALLDATAGPAPGDPYVAPPPARPWLEEVGRDPGRLRIAVTRSAPNGAVVHPDCVAAVDEAAGLAAALGHHVAEAAPILDGQMLTEAFFTLWSAGCAWTVADWARRTGQTPDPARFEPLTWVLHEMGERRSAAALSHRGSGSPAHLPRGRPLLRRLGRLAHPDPGRAAPCRWAASTPPPTTPSAVCDGRPPSCRSPRCSM